MISVLFAGLFTTIQDLGRFGYRNIGVPNSGVMDSISANLANSLLNNKESDALIEITMSGPKLQFLEPTFIALSGADISPNINEIPILNNKKYEIQKNDILSFGQLKNGMRCYLAVQGGIKSEKTLGSRSFYQNITSQNHLKKGSLVKYLPSKKMNEKKSIGQIKPKKPFYLSEEIEVFKGPELELFTLKDCDKIQSKNYSISNRNNRMGYRLNETTLKHKKSIITSPVLPGTVQLTPSGKLIVLMKDAQTTGGYPRIFQLSEKSIAIMAQKKTGDIIKFKLIKN